MSSKNNIEKLPKWAQEHIRSMEYRIDYLVKALQDYCGDSGGSVVVNPYSDNSLRLPDDTSVSFELPTLPGERTEYIKICFKDGGIELYATFYPVAILSRSNNIFVLKKIKEEL